MAAPHAALLMIGRSDPFISFVKHLTHFDGANGSNSFPQTIGANAFGPSGASVLSTSEKAFGTASVSVPSNNNVNAPSNANYAIGSNDFVIELWVRPTNNTGSQVYFDGRPASEGAYPAIYANGTSLRYYVSSADRITGSVMTAAAWQYIAVARVSGTTRMYRGTLGGGTAAQVGSNYTDGTTYIGMPLRLGQGSFGTGPAPGHYDDFRLTVGSGRGFTGATIPVPTTAFPNF